MSEEEGGAIYYITKEEFKRRLAEMNVGMADIGKRYTTLLAKNPDGKHANKWKIEIDSIAGDLQHNLDMMTRVDIEHGYCLMWVDGENSLKMRRCSAREFKEIYTVRKPNYVI